MAMIIKSEQESRAETINVEDSIVPVVQQEVRIAYHDLRPVICDYGGIHEIIGLPTEGYSESLNIDEGHETIHSSRSISLRTFRRK